MTLISLVVAVATMVGYLAIVWWLDRYDREPIGLLLANFLWGALGAILLSLASGLVVQQGVEKVFHGILPEKLSGAIITAPIVEEPTKGVFFFFTAINRRFDNITDGAVYGAAIGLGFGMTENFFYYLSAASMNEWAALVVIRTLFSAVMHCMSTATLGAFVGLAKFRPIGQKLALVPSGLLIAMFIHFAWNVSVSFAATAVFGLIFVLLGVILTFGLFQLSLSLENRMIRRELSEEVENGLIPAEHLEYLPFASRRKRSGWCPSHVDRRKYIQLATELAFRKDQSRRCPSKNRDSYLAEVESLRGRLSPVLHPPVPSE